MVCMRGDERTELLRHTRVLELYTWKAIALEAVIESPELL